MKAKFIGQRIREFREDLGLTQREFAKRILINPAYLSRVEQGAQQVGMKTLEMICRTFSTDLSNFLLTEDEKKVLKQKSKALTKVIGEFIDGFYKLPPKKQKIILDFFHLFVKKRKTGR